MHAICSNSMDTWESHKHAVIVTRLILHASCAQITPQVAKEEVRPYPPKLPLLPKAYRFSAVSWTLKSSAVHIRCVNMCIVFLETYQLSSTCLVYSFHCTIHSLLGIVKLSFWGIHCIYIYVFRIRGGREGGGRGRGIRGVFMVYRHTHAVVLTVSSFCYTLLKSKVFNVLWYRSSLSMGRSAPCSTLNSWGR